MAKTKIFDNFDREIKNNSLICIVGEKCHFGYVTIVEGGLKFHCMQTGYLDNETIIIKKGIIETSWICTYEDLEKMNIVIIKEGED